MEYCAIRDNVTTYMNNAFTCSKGHDVCISGSAQWPVAVPSFQHHKRFEVGAACRLSRLPKIQHKQVPRPSFKCLHFYSCANALDNASASSPKSTRFVSMARNTIRLQSNVTSKVRYYRCARARVPNAGEP
eukprot:6199772-Pleurochrysis_carterae.AAC.1